MGGLGSGRWPGYMSSDPSKETTEDYFNLDIREVKRYGLVEPGQGEIFGVARLEWAPAGFGGERGSFLRPWFLCPREGCGRRVAILYGKKDPNVHPAWACRKCLDLCYPVERADRAGRALRRMLKARDRLGPGNAKPKGMHHKTFVKLTVDYVKAVEKYQEARRERLVNLIETMEKEKIKFDL